MTLVKCIMAADCDKQILTNNATQYERCNAKINLSLFIPWRHTVGAEAQLHSFLTYRCEWSTSHPICFIPKQRTSSIHWKGSWVGPRASLNVLMPRKITCPSSELKPGPSHTLLNHYIDYTSDSLILKKEKELNVIQYFTAANRKYFANLVQY